MKPLLAFLLCIISFSSIGQLNDREIRDLKTGRVRDDSSYDYWLPYQKGDRHLFIQGANSGFSHKGELSFDFKMKKGSKICAARPGTVIGIKFDIDQGGLKDEF